MEKFLVQKQINNTADGSLGWAHEGNYLYEPFERHLNKIEKHILSLFLNRDVNQEYLIADVNMNGYKFFPQIIWVVALIFILFATIGDSHESSPNLCVKYFSQAQVVQGMRMHPCLSTITLEGAVKGAPSAHLEEVPLTASERVIHLTQLLVFVVPLPILLVQQPS